MDHAGTGATDAGLASLSRLSVRVPWWLERRYPGEWGGVRQQLRDIERQVKELAKRAGGAA